jgi:aminoglycoside phosphotransferase (APT) family kinase protein
LPDQFEQQLIAVLSREVDGFESLESCHQLSAGASQETWRISYRCPDGNRLLALRRAQPTADGGSTVGTITLDTEALLIQLAEGHDIPSPRVIYVLQPEDGLGNGFLMDWLEGETLGQRIVASEELADIRPQLARQCGEILGRLHAIDYQQHKLDSLLPAVEPEQLVDETWNYYRELNVPVPMIDYCWRWLKENLPSDSRRTLVHGDYRNGNLMINPGGIAGVLDWELAHIGDPVRDLGYLCVNSWRFGHSHLPVGGFGEVNDLLEGYRATSGIDIKPEELLFWRVFGSFWWAMATMLMANGWRTGETPSLERPVIGRRSSEAQMDCVNLLIPGEFELPKASPALDKGTQLPMPAELLEGVKSFLREDVSKKLEPHDSFLARVAANSLGIAQRELILGPDLAAEEQLRLQDLLNQKAPLDELRWQLVNALREDLPLDAPGLAGHLRQTAAGQLSIDQPHYSALKH